MYNFESSRFVAPNSSSLAYIFGLSLCSLILDNNVRRLKDLNRERMGAVLSDCLEETREKGGADDLILGGFGIRQFDGLCAVVFAVQPGKVLVV